MNAELISYFTAEKNGAIVLLSMAAISFMVSYLLWQSKSVFIAMAWPLLILGTFELIVGGTIAWRTPAQVQQLEAGIANDLPTTAAEELTRMQRVNANFRIVKVIEGIFIGIGVLAVLVFPLGSTWSSVGLGLTIQGATLLVFDAFAHHRAELYVQWLQSI